MITWYLGWVISDISSAFRSLASLYPFRFAYSVVLFTQYSGSWNLMFSSWLDIMEGSKVAFVLELDKSRVALSMGWCNLRVPSSRYRCSRFAPLIYLLYIPCPYPNQNHYRRYKVPTHYFDSYCSLSPYQRTSETLVLPWQRSEYEKTSVSSLRQTRWKHSPQQYLVHF